MQVIKYWELPYVVVNDWCSGWLTMWTYMKCIWSLPAIHKIIMNTSWRDVITWPYFINTWHCIILELPLRILFVSIHMLQNFNSDHYLLSKSILIDYSPPFFITKVKLCYLVIINDTEIIYRQNLFFFALWHLLTFLSTLKVRYFSSRKFDPSLSAMHPNVVMLINTW